MGVKKRDNIMEVQLATTLKGVSVPDLIRSIDNPGGDNGKPFPMEQESYLRNLCSTTFKFEFPLRKYSVKRVSDKGYALVFWNYKED